MQIQAPPGQLWVQYRCSKAARWAARASSPSAGLRIGGAAAFQNGAPATSSSVMWWIAMVAGVIGWPGLTKAAPCWSFRARASLLLYHAPAPTDLTDIVGGSRRSADDDPNAREGIAGGRLIAETRQAATGQGSTGADQEGATWSTALLFSSMVPSCSSTCSLDQGEADAKAFLRPLGRVLHLGEQVENLRLHVIGNADAVVGTRSRRRCPTPWRTGGSYALGCTLAALLSRLLTTWATGRRPARSACFNEDVDGQGVLIGVDLRLAGLDGKLEEGLQGDFFLAQRELALIDPRNVQQVFDQTRQVHHLPVHLRGVSWRGRGRHGCMRCRPAPRAITGFAQLVPEHGEELVQVLELGNSESWF